MTNGFAGEMASPNYAGLAVELRRAASDPGGGQADLSARSHAARKAKTGGG